MRRWLPVQVLYKFCRQRFCSKSFLRGGVLAPCSSLLVSHPGGDVGMCVSITVCTVNIM